MNDNSVGGSSHDGVAEMKPRLANLVETIAGNADEHPDTVWAELYDHLTWLWENPDGFEAGNAVGEWEDTPPLMLFELGVLFGIEYEQAYPEGKNDEWPVPLADRPSEEDTDAE